MAEQVTTQQDIDQEQGGRPWRFWVVVGRGALAGTFVLGLILAVVLALFVDLDGTANWVGIIRDIFIIILAMEGMMIGIALIVLILQLAALLNLLQNEVQPIVDNANETVTTVRGTAQFMSQNLVEPVIKVSALMAGISGLLRESMRIRRNLNAAGQQSEDKGKG